MKKNQKIKALKIALLGIASSLLLSSCGTKNNEEKEAEPVSYQINNEQTLLKETVNKYNEYLSQINSHNHLTEDDIKAIVNNILGNCLLYDPNTNQEQKTSLYDFVEFDQNKINVDKLENINTYPIITLGEFVLENQVPETDYAILKNVKYPQEQDDVILSFYGEDVLKCFQTIGYPTIIYNVNDLIDAYNKIDETKKSLDAYNSYLECTNQDSKITEEMLEDIVKYENSYVQIKNANNTFQVDLEKYDLVNSEEGIKLYYDNSITDGDYTFQVDFLSGEINYSQENYEVISTLKEMLDESDISSIGIGIQKFKTENNLQSEYIAKKYGETILECFQQVGFPMNVYNAEDIYNYTKEQTKSR